MYVCSQIAAQLIYLDWALLQHHFTASLYTKPVTWGEIIFPEDLRLDFFYYFDDNKFTVETKSYSSSNARYNENKSASFILFARMF